MNLKILEFRQSIQKYIREIELPDEVKRMVLTDILREQEAITYEVLKQELAERDKKEEEVNNNAESI